MQPLPGLRRRGHESVELLVINMFIEWTSHILNPHTNQYEFRWEFAFGSAPRHRRNPNRSQGFAPECNASAVQSRFQLPWRPVRWSAGRQFLRSEERRVGK